MMTATMAALLTEVKLCSNSTFNLVERGKCLLCEMMLLISISNNVIFQKKNIHSVPTWSRAVSCCNHILKCTKLLVKRMLDQLTLSDFMLRKKAV